MACWKGGNAWEKFVAEAAGSSNGRTSPSGGEYLGSSPSPAALKINLEVLDSNLGWGREGGVLPV